MPSGKGRGSHDEDAARPPGSDSVTLAPRYAAMRRGKGFGTKEPAPTVKKEDDGKEEGAAVGVAVVTTPTAEEALVAAGMATPTATVAVVEAEEGTPTVLGAVDIAEATPTAPGTGAAVDAEEAAPTAPGPGAAVEAEKATPTAPGAGTAFDAEEAAPTAPGSGAAVAAAEATPTAAKEEKNSPTEIAHAAAVKVEATPTAAEDSEKEDIAVEEEPLPIPKRKRKKDESESLHASRPAATLADTGPQVKQTKAMMGTVIARLLLSPASLHRRAGKGVDPHPLPRPAYLQKGGSGKNPQSPRSPVGATDQHQRTGGLVLVLPGPVRPDRGPEAHGDQ